MLKRAANCVVIASIAAVFGFSGILHRTAGIAQSICFVFAGFCILSFLFSLFEDSPAPSTSEILLDEPQRTRPMPRPVTLTLSMDPGDSRRGNFQPAVSHAS
jgi:uncharacterized membrane protein YtjA (UPF0391 family)